MKRFISLGAMMAILFLSGCVELNQYVAKMKPSKEPADKTTVSKTGHKPYKRIYANDIPPLQIVAVAMSESPENAAWALEEYAKKDSELELKFPILLDTPAEISGSAVGLSFSGIKKQKKGDDAPPDPWEKQGKGGFTYKSHVSELYRLTKEYCINFLIIDRSGRIRALGHSLEQITGFYGSDYIEVVEYLLLNLKGTEALPYNPEKMKTRELKKNVNGTGVEIWETSAELKRREKKGDGGFLKLGKFTFGSEPRIYPLLGEKAPDFVLPEYKGKGQRRFSKLSNGKVTLLVLFWTGGDKTNSSSLTNLAQATGGLQTIDKLYNDFTLKMAVPGKKNHQDAHPK
jgi:hypothetical protein